MSDLHDLCRFSERPITDKYLDELKYYLKSGIPSTYTIEEAYNYINGIEEEPTTTTTPLHLIATHLPQDCTEKEMYVVNEMVLILFEYGAGWCLTDVNNETPGCILIRRKLKETAIYVQIVDAGVRAELLLRKVSEYDMEVIEDTDDVDHDQFGEIPELVTGEPEEKADEEQKETEKNENEAEETESKQEEGLRQTSTEAKSSNDEPAPELDPSHNQDAYLKTKLEYKNGALVTESNQDGVMMEWETDLMRLGCDSVFKGAVVDGKPDTDVNILNIGFGMGIIDTMINNKNPIKHYICEAHPDVLQKLKDDGWYEKPNVVILEGRWQEQLEKLLGSGDVYFNGIYYDTFSEHYQDMLELFDYVVGLLKPHGIFSFFNGLGADRQVIYEVYKKLVEIDLSNYGLQCDFIEVDVPEKTLKRGDDSVWDGIRKAYWLCPTFYHPEARFIDFN